MIYIAAPFWHESSDIRQQRRNKAIAYSERLFNQGKLFYSPLLYSEKFKDKKQKENFWINHGLKMVEVCTEMHVLCLEGWEDSNGIQGEVAKANELNIEVKYIQKHTRVSFHGSRSLTEKQCKPIIVSVFEKHQVETVVTHGEPHGACEWVRKSCKEKAISLKLHFLPKHRLAGMFHWRSVAVLEDSEIAIFLHDGISDGTANELELCRKMGCYYEYYKLKDNKLILDEVKDQYENKNDESNLIDDIYEKKLTNKDRQTPEYQSFRKAVLKRDNNKCVFCGATEKICVHHIIPFSKNVGLSTEISNGQTLCIVCHEGVHGKRKFKS